jgi:pimeloyl-ACP methyl ester carboxylesterase
VAQIADAVGIERFAAMGASGGGPHALACASALHERVIGVVTLAGIAPYTDAFDWFAGMADPSALRAALEGRAARERHEEHFDEDSFTAADWSALQDRWASLGQDAMKAGTAGTGGLVDDDLAFAASWGFSLGEIDVPVLVVQGGQDRVVPPAHADWLLRHIPTAELWLRPRDGHVSILDAVPVAMDWLRALS